ncbi:hypothetical protein CAT59_03910, partial [Acinetobacter pittii]
LALMVVWGYPCESKSSPAHYSKHPHSNEWGCFFIVWNLFLHSLNIKIDFIQKNVERKCNQLEETG